jgi:hypothetical protein
MRGRVLQQQVGAAAVHHHHVLHHAEFEWQALNATVTDWQRHRYFERI